MEKPIVQIEIPQYIDDVYGFRLFKALLLIGDEVYNAVRSYYLQTGELSLERVIVLETNYKIENHDGEINMIGGEAAITESMVECLAIWEFLHTLFLDFGLHKDEFNSTTNFGTFYQSLRDNGEIRDPMSFALSSPDDLLNQFMHDGVFERYSPLIERCVRATTNREENCLLYVLNLGL